MNRQFWQIIVIVAILSLWVIHFFPRYQPGTVLPGQVYTVKDTWTGEIVVKKLELQK